MGVDVSWCTITLNPFDKVKRSKLTTDLGFNLRVPLLAVCKNIAKSNVSPTKQIDSGVYLVITVRENFNIMSPANE
jgi:hypothetical protein